MPFSRAWFAQPIETFLSSTSNAVLGDIAAHNTFELTENQRNSWLEQTEILRAALQGLQGMLYLEFAVPRMGDRIDALCIIGPIVFVFEFKVGESGIHQTDVDQVMDYALDLHHFHEGSHRSWIAPVLIPTCAPDRAVRVAAPTTTEFLYDVSVANPESLRATIETLLSRRRDPAIDAVSWERSAYKPTPTIIEATLALYRTHSVAEISRSDAEATNLSLTSKTIEDVITRSRARAEKSICFVTGVPGAGKTLVGLNVATSHMDPSAELYSVFLSGNGPLVKILQEALARDKVARLKAAGEKIRKGQALSQVKAFVQNVHHFRDDCLADPQEPPVEHVAIFDEAQRAWDLQQTAAFMKRKKGVPDFMQSEPEFLISCLNRHRDWAVVICLVGGGQEINTGEAGIAEWARALRQSFPDWKSYASDRLMDAEYGSGAAIDQLRMTGNFEVSANLHLSTSLRSFRSDRVSHLVKQLLDLESASARETVASVTRSYPMFLTRDLDAARRWLRRRALGSERYGIVVSSQAERLKPYAVDVKTPIDPVVWFLNGKDDVRSSYYLEDVATEFHVQGLELDWTCVVWDADLRYEHGEWRHYSFRGNRWQNINAPERKIYLKNAYRVLLTRARQGMVVVVPRGDASDPTRNPKFYDATFEYLRSECQLPLLPPES